MPLHLLAGLETSLTPPTWSQRRRTSPGMSEKSKKCSMGCQSGPSVNSNPVPNCWTGESTPIRSLNSGRMAWCVNFFSSNRFQRRSTDARTNATTASQSCHWLDSKHVHKGGRSIRHQKHCQYRAVMIAKRQFAVENLHPRSRASAS